MLFSLWVILHAFLSSPFFKKKFFQKFRQSVKFEAWQFVTSTFNNPSTMEHRCRWNTNVVDMVLSICFQVYKCNKQLYILNNKFHNWNAAEYLLKDISCCAYYYVLCFVCLVCDCTMLQQLWSCREEGQFTNQHFSSTSLAKRLTITLCTLCPIWNSFLNPHFHNWTCGMQNLFNVKSKKVWPGSTTITQCKPIHDSVC